MTKEIEISSDEITLGQFLKFADIVSSGGDVKPFLQEHKIKVNGQEENRRGRKLRSGDVVEIEGFERLVIATAKRI